MWFINTRPSDRAKPLTKLLKQKGVDVINLPLLALKPLVWSVELTQQFLELQQAQVIVVVSPTAATLGLQALKNLNIHFSDLKGITWIAVGKATAKVLEKVGLHPITPHVENSEGVLALPILKSLVLNKVAVWRGKDGRQFLLEYLAKQQVEVLNCVLYTREQPIQSLSIFESNQHMLEHTVLPIYICMTSEASWQNWLAISRSSPYVLSKCHYLTLGERLTNLVKNTHLNLQVTQIQCLSFDEIYTQMLDVKKSR